MKPHNGNYNGNFYAEIGNFLGEHYLNYGFTKGTVHEVDFLVDLLDLPKGSTIIDIGCGPGRHSLELARRGFKPTGIDITSSFIAYAQQQALADDLDATFLTADARSLPVMPSFDAAICLCEGAFGLAGDDEGHQQILREVHRVLKPGSLFVLTALNALSAVSRDEQMNAYTNTSSVFETITSPAGHSKEVEIHTTAFTFRELKLLLQQSGFRVRNGYGCIAGNFSEKPLSISDMEIMMVAERI